MNPQKTSYVQIALIFAAMAAGGIVTRIVPDRVPLAAYVPHLDKIPATAVFKSASTKKPKHDSSRDLSGFDVDLHQLALLARVS